MSRIAYVNGRYVPHAAARVHIDDRGYQFADAVYEVCEIYRGRMVDETRHLDRLDRSLRELRIGWPVTRRALSHVLREVARRNRVHEGFVYLQVSRGVARRDHVFPAVAPRPALVVTARMGDRQGWEALAAIGVGVITVADIRWGRVDIKTTGLLPNVLAKQQAKEAGAREAWLVDAAGQVTEGGSTNAWIVTHDGRLVTRQTDDHILAGVTRHAVLDLVSRRNLTLEERAFTPSEALQAAEAFMTSAGNPVMPVVSIDGRPVGDGRPGPVSQALRAALRGVTEMSLPVFPSP